MAFFALLEIILALAGIKPRSATEDPYVGFARGAQLFLPGEDSVTGEPVYRTNPVKLAHFNLQSFPRKKAEGTTRIFCLGGSSTYGHPFRDPTSFCGQLRAYLPAAYPDRPFELINAGGISYASYRVAELMKELGRYEPDLYIVYSGHNEFLEERTYRSQASTPGWIRETSALLDRTRIMTVLRRALAALGAGAGAETSDAGEGMAAAETDSAGGANTAKAGERSGDNRTRLAGEVNDVLSHTIGPSSYERDDSLRTAVLRHYRFSLQRMANLAREQGAVLMLATTPSNERSCSPFKSEPTPGLSNRDKAEIGARMDAGEAAWHAGDSARALDLFRQAATADPRHAAVAYRTAEAAFALGNYPLAREYFIRALEEDVCPLRALPAMEEAVRATARENTDEKARESARTEGVLLLDFADSLRAFVRDRDGHALLGEPEFLDHVHPSISVNGHIARAAMAVLRESAFLPAPAADAETRLQAAADSVEGILADADQALGLHNVAKVLNWAGKHEDAARIARRALALDTVGLESIWSSLFVAAALEREGRGLDALSHYRRALRLDSTNSVAWMHLAGGLRRNGFEDEAAQAADRALALAPGDPDVLEEAGYGALHRGQWRKAATLFGQATALQPKEETARLRAASLLSDGDLPAAEAAFQALRRNYPASPWGVLGLGDVAAARGDFNQAISAYSAVANGDGGTASQVARDKLGRLLTSGMLPGGGPVPGGGP